MTPALVRQHVRHTATVPDAETRARARDWSEIQERMLVPLYEAVYARLDVGSGTRLLALGCGSGLALLLAAARGATVTGVDSSCPERLALARRRLLPEPWDTRTRATARIVDGPPRDAAVPGGPAYTLVTAFEPIACTSGSLAGDSEGPAGLLAAATPLAERGAPVVLTGWGPPERCATSSVLRVAAKLADPLRSPGSRRPAPRDGLEEVARRAGLRPDGSGRVACPFGYAELGSAVRGLLSTGLFDAAVAATDRNQVDKELTEALHAHQRPDGTVWMPNVFRYLIARTP
ncbi:SAM-dependent methyltransferase [Streptomyces sp. NPDC001212]|uniref:SAM-dependent methyltransferase n=1 Tax=unclassified Streptomyces TaxID=2593676 RepID=UPI001CD411F2|nr:MULTISPECIES: SAM-dependent methyltransferase [unclassified Streptomyces]